MASSHHLSGTRRRVKVARRRQSGGPREEEIWMVSSGSVSARKVNGVWGQGVRGWGGQEADRIDVFAAMMPVLEFVPKFDGSSKGGRAEDVLIKAIAVERSVTRIMPSLIDLVRERILPAKGIPYKGEEEDRDLCTP